MEKRPSFNEKHVDAWRIFRILSEFVDGFETMTDIGPSVTVFGSARVKPTNVYYQLAVEVTKKIAEKGFGIITGGGPGIMEAANKGAQVASGISCGININLPFEEDSNPYVNPKYRLKLRYFFVRKVLFIRYAQAFVFLPGGFGTMDELFEALTLIHTHKIKPTPIFLMGSDYWEGLIRWLKEYPLKQSYLEPTDLELLTISDDPDFVAQQIEKHFKETGPVPTFDLGGPTKNDTI